METWRPVREDAEGGNEERREKKFYGREEPRNVMKNLQQRLRCAGRRVRI